MPAEVPLVAKTRLGIVGPGTEGNQRSNSAKSCASALSAGTWLGAKHFMMCPPLPPPTRPS